MGLIPAVVPAAAADAAWLSAVLREAGRIGPEQIVDVQRAPCGVGQLADSFRFTVRYDRPTAAASTWVAKFASRDATSREFGRSSGYYRSEIGFYRELAARMPVSVPVAVHAALDTNQTDFVLLMEDLAPARQVDQLDGCSADESARVLEQAAALHAKSWHSAELAKVDWLQSPLKIFTHATDAFADIVQRFPDLCGDLVPDQDLRVAAQLIDHAERWKQLFATPQCLWHSDLRADNVMFDAAAGQRSVVILDWQGLGYGLGTIDVAYWLGTRMATSERRSHERALVDHDHAALVGHGVRDYSRERCWNDYRRNAVHGLQIGVFGLGAVKRSPRGDRMRQNWIARTAAQVRDLHSYAALERSS